MEEIIISVLIAAHSLTLINILQTRSFPSAVGALPPASLPPAPCCGVAGSEPQALNAPMHTLLVRGPKSRAVNPGLPENHHFFLANGVKSQQDGSRGSAVPLATCSHGTVGADLGSPCQVAARSLAQPNHFIIYLFFLNRN